MSILSKIEITEQEQNELCFKQDDENGNLTWDLTKDNPLEPMFTHDEMEYLKEACQKQAGNSLGDDMWSTVKKIYDAIEAEAN